MNYEKHLIKTNMTVIVLVLP